MDSIESLLWIGAGIMVISLTGAIVSSYIRGVKLNNKLMEQDREWKVTLSNLENSAYTIGNREDNSTRNKDSY